MIVACDGEDASGGLVGRDQAFPDQGLPGVTLGAGYAWDRVTLDAAYAHLFIEERTVSATIRDPEPFGKYESAANIFGASVTVAF